MSQSITTIAAEAILKVLPLLVDVRLRVVGVRGLLTLKRSSWRPAVDFSRLQSLELHCVKGPRGSKVPGLVLDLLPLVNATNLQQLWLDADLFENEQSLCGLVGLQVLRVEVMGKEGAEVGCRLQAAVQELQGRQEQEGGSGAGQMQCTVVVARSKAVSSKGK
jgi:hypothetical protein